MPFRHGHVCNLLDRHELAIARTRVAMRRPVAVLMSSAGVFLLAAFAALGVVIAAWPLLAARLHRRRMAIVLALVTVLVGCSIVGQYLFDQAGNWIRLDHHSSGCH